MSKKTFMASDLFKVLGNMHEKEKMVIRIADAKGNGGRDVGVFSCHKELRDGVPTLVVCSDIQWTTPTPKGKTKKVEPDDDAWTPEQEAAWLAFLATDCVEVCDAAPYFPE